MFKFKAGINASYERQGYIYFKSLNYKMLSQKEKSAIDKLCISVGKEYSDALFKFVTTDTTATKICLEYYISKATLYRIVKRYYETFPPEL